MHSTIFWSQKIKDFELLTVMEEFNKDLVNNLVRREKEETSQCCSEPGMVTHIKGLRSYCNPFVYFHQVIDVYVPNQWVTEWAYLNVPSFRIGGIQRVKGWYCKHLCAYVYVRGVWSLFLDFQIASNVPTATENLNSRLSLNGSIIRMCDLYQE